VFSALVTWTYKVHAGLFYVYYAALLGIYAWSLMSVIVSTTDIGTNRAVLAMFVVGILTLHSTTLAAYKLEIGDLRDLFTGGVASKTMLSSYLVPSSFSVFILLSVAFFLRGYPYVAVAANAVAGTFHAHYLLPAALLTLPYLWLYWRDTQRIRSLLALGGVAFALVVPIVVYNATRFESATPTLHAQALHIFNHFRIPHHVELHRWMGVDVVLKALFIIAAFVLMRKTRLFVILLPLFMVTVLLTVVQLWSGNEDLAYLLPWRYMVFLVPVATAMLLAVGVRTVVGALSYSTQRLLLIVAVVWVGVLLYPGAKQVYGLVRTNIPYVDQNARPMVEHIRQHREPGQLYLVPPRLQTFRLAAGIPIFVDWKTVPFGDEGVLEWYRRYRLADAFYEASPAQRWATLTTLVQNEKITHVVFHTETLGDVVPLSHVIETFRSPVYTVYEVRQ